MVYFNQTNEPETPEVEGVPDETEEETSDEEEKSEEESPGPTGVPEE